MPLIFIVIIPAIAAMLPGVELTPKLALVPILNVSLLCKELVIGTYHWNYIAIIFASTCVYAAAALFLAIKMFQRERSEEHTSELQSQSNLVCRLLLEKKKKINNNSPVNIYN